MEKSETIGKLTLALSKVQAQLKPAKENSKNPFFKSSYADLGAVWDSVRKLLAENELDIIQMPTDVGGVTTILSHSNTYSVASSILNSSFKDMISFTKPNESRVLYSENFFSILISELFISKDSAKEDKTLSLIFLLNLFIS